MFSFLFVCFIPLHLVSKESAKSRTKDKWDVVLILTQLSTDIDASDMSLLTWLGLKYLVYWTLA